LVNCLILSNFQSKFSDLLDDNLSIEEALDAIIQEEDVSANPKATLEIKDTDDEIEVSDEDDAVKH
jgi:hypothetical protein